LGKIASRVVPGLGIPSGLQGKDLTHDAEVAAKYDADPLVFKKATARWFTEATRAQAEAIAGARRMQKPLYLALGTADCVASPEGGRAFFEACGSSDKTKREWSGLFHEILNEPDWRTVAGAMSEWMLAHA
jgi:alpha-beta hydrolase superfamily lysophospholipase